MPNKKCALIDETGNCQLMHLPAPNDCRCPHYTNDLPTCGICGKATLETLITQIEDRWVHLCPECNAKLGTCATCEKVSHCLFHEDNSPLPKYVPKTIQQGGAVIQTQVPNPERVNATCAFCDCYNGDRCCRSDSYCTNYVEAINLI